MRPLKAPFFEIGPKNLLRRSALTDVLQAAAAAGSEFDVTVVLTVPVALIAPLADISQGVQIYSQAMDTDRLGTSFGSITAESLVDAGASGVMLNHDARPLSGENLAACMERIHEEELGSILCAGSEHDAASAAALAPTAVLYEPPELIGTVDEGMKRPWIEPINALLASASPDVLRMHAGGVSSPEVARSIMAAGADGTGSTSGVLTAPDLCTAVHQFIRATRIGWDTADKTLKKSKVENS